MIRYIVALALAVSTVGSTAVPASAASDTAIFAGGCFWCVESDFDHVPGVTSTTSGYIGGSIKNPTYRNHPGFREAVRITFDPSKTDYAKLLTAFWHSVDPTDAGGQFCDRGHSYTTAIYATDAAQLKQAKASKKQIAKELGKPIATEIAMAPTFWPAEAYHQNFYKKNPLHYAYYRQGCGRDRQVKALWGAKADEGITPH